MERLTLLRAARALPCNAVSIMRTSCVSRLRILVSDRLQWRRLEQLPGIILFKLHRYVRRQCKVCWCLIRQHYQFLVRLPRSKLLARPLMFLVQQLFEKLVDCRRQ